MSRSKIILYLCIIMLPLFFSQALAMMSVEKEKELREKLLKMVKSQVPLATDPEVIEYVSYVGNKLLSNVPDPLFQYQFYVIKDEGMNAFAMPGGIVFVHTGLLENIDSENELACVLAHEIAHVQGRHIARRMERMQRVNIASLAVAIAGLFLGDARASSAIFATAGAFNASMALKYSREDEEEADRRAFKWICSAGYNPMGLARVLRKMQKYRWLGTDAIPSYLSTHPGAAQRITYIEDLWHRHPCNETVKEDRFRLKRIQVKVAVLTHDPVVLARRYARELKANPEDVFLQYGLAQSLLAARDYDESIAAFKRLISMPQGKRFLEELGIAYFSAGRYKEAIKILKPYTQSHPKDLSGLYYLARSYLELRYPERAIRILKDLEASWSDKASLWFQMGRAMAQLDEQGKAHYYFYLHYKESGNMRTASFHRQKALELLPKDSQMYRELKDDLKNRQEEFDIRERSQG